MFRTFRTFVGAIESLAGSVRGLVIALAHDVEQRAEAGGALERLEALERTRSMWEAEMEALVLKAEGKLKASNNSEARARTMVRHYEKEFDPLDPDRDEVEDGIPAGYAPAGAEERLHAMPESVAVEPKKALATRVKFGV